MNSKVLFLLVVCAVIASPVFSSESRFCTACKGIVDNVKKMVSAGKDIEEAIREECDASAPRFLKSVCRRFLNGLSMLHDHIQ
ncbi:hypothetical protein OSTOST_24714 [Ostertagia ostertagi]